MANENKTTIVIDAKDTSAAAFSKFGKNLSDAERNISGFGKGLSGTTAAITQMFNPMMMLTGTVTAAVTGLGALVSKSLETSDEISKMAQKTGFTTESLSTLKYAAELSDIQFDTFGGTLIKFNKAIIEASDGTGEQSKAFQSLGIELRNQDGSLKKNNELLLQLADKFSNMPDGMEKTTIALKLFGKTGADMIPFLDTGKTGIEELTKAAKDMGLEVSQEAGKRAEEFNDRITTLGNRAKGAGIQITTELMPSLEALLKILEESIIPIVDLGSDSIGFMVEQIGGLTAELGKFIDSPIGYVLDDLISLAETLGMIKNEPYIKLDGGGKSKEEIEQVKAMYAQGIAYVPGEGYVHLIPDDVKSKSNSKKEKKDPNQEFLDRQKDHYTLLNDAASDPNLQAMGLDMTVPKLGISQEEIDRMTETANLYYSAEVAAKQAALDEEMRIDEMRMQSQANTFGNMAATMDTFYKLSGEKSKALFNLGKAFAIAQAVVNIHQGVTKALATEGIWGMLEAGSIIAAGMAQIATISSTQPGSTGGGSSSGSSYIPSSHSAPTSNNSNNNQQQNITHTTNIIVYGSVVDHEKFARDIVPAINNAVKDGVELYATSG